MCSGTLALSTVSAVGLWPFPLHLQWAAVSFVLEVRSGRFHCICKGTLAISIVFTVRLAVFIVFTVRLAVSVVFAVRPWPVPLYLQGDSGPSQCICSGNLAIFIVFGGRFWSFPLHLQWVSGPFHCICSGTVRFHHTCMQCMYVGVIMTCPAVA